MKSKHFLTLLDIPKEEIKNLVHRAIELKKMTKENIVYTPLQKKHLHFYLINHPQEQEFLLKLV